MSMGKRKLTDCVLKTLSEWRELPANCCPSWRSFRCTGPSFERPTVGLEWAGRTKVPGSPMTDVNRLWSRKRLEVNWDDRDSNNRQDNPPSGGCWENSARCWRQTATWYRQPYGSRIGLWNETSPGLFLLFRKDFKFPRIQRGISFYLPCPTVGPPRCVRPLGWFSPCSRHLFR